jgi:tetratricopeptide (TPR) repeat protein
MAEAAARRARIDTGGSTHGDASPPGAADETLPGSLHARVVRGLARGATVGRYLILEEIGRGGMGVVYAAYDPDLDRRIAIKVLRGRSDEGSAGSARLLREAQALAKLAHPNVIAVFDVGTVPLVPGVPAAAAPVTSSATGDPHADEVFVAMELVPGGTLREAVERKPWREIIAAYAAAGRGLAAAHAAGLVHRDFKPENVLVGADGRPRVTDFGLVRATAGGATDPNPGRGRPGGGASPSALDSDLTAAGTVMGTPSYMAPEQMIGEPTSAATDQFSFAVALWEALFGVKPYAGKDVATTHAAVVAGHRTPYERGEVPVRVVRTLERALAAAPAERWLSMDGLLADLEAAARPPAPRWLIASIGLGGAALAAATGLIIAAGDRTDECARAGDPAKAVWTRAPVEAAFRTAAPDYGPGAVDVIEARIGAWRDDWQRRAHAACTATRVDRTQSDEVLDLRTSCLGRQLESVRAVVDGLAHADAVTVERAGDVLGELPELGECDDVQVLRGRQPRPSDPATRAAIATLERELAHLDGRRKTTFAAEPRKVLAADVTVALERAAATSYAPVIAQARAVEGQLALDAADGKAARAALLASAQAAIRGGDPALLADAYVGLGDAAIDLADYADAHTWLDLGGAVIDGLHEAGGRVIDLESKRATLGREEGDLKAQRAAIDRGVAAGAGALSVEDRLWFGTERVLADMNDGAYDDAQRGIDELMPVARAHWGEGHPRTAHLIHDAGNLALYRGRYADAEALHREALAIREAAYGATSAELLDNLDALGIDLSSQGKIDDARALYERALVIAKAKFGADSIKVARLLGGLGGVYHRAKDSERELAINRDALAIQLKVLGPDHMDTAMTQVNIGIAAKNLGRARKDRALVALAIDNEEAARKVFVAKLGTEHFNVGAVDANLGEAYRAAGRAADAIAAFTRAQDVMAKVAGAEHPVIADPLTGHGLVLIETGRAAQAVPLLERAVTLRGAPDVDAGDLADSQFALAKALRATRRDAARATQLATAARAVWQDRGLAERAAEAARFLGD